MVGIRSHTCPLVMLPGMFPNRVRCCRERVSMSCLRFVPADWAGSVCSAYTGI